MLDYNRNKDCAEWTSKSFVTAINGVISEGTLNRLVSAKSIESFALTNNIAIVVDQLGEYTKDTEIVVSVVGNRKFSFFGRVLFVGMNESSAIGLTEEEINFIKETTTILSLKALVRS